MAVEVIARNQAAAKKLVLCHNCGAMLSYFPIDIQKYEGKDIGGGPDGHWWIDCPDCKERVILKSW